MIEVSDAYKELVKSNIRPKCEPVIKVSGLDDNGNEVELIWQAKNIKDMTFKRGIDPVGRELPYLELTWTEIYTGEFNETNYPEKYNNIAKYMEVELSFVQDLSFYNTWKTIFNSGTTWRDLLSKTWKQVKNKVSQEIITMPKMFLSARPTISGQTITWVAKDLLSFANEKQIYEFKGGENVTLKNVISYFILNMRGVFLNSQNLFNAYTNTATNLLNQNNIQDVIDKRIICDGSSNNIILNLASIYNYYWDFKNDILILNKFNPSSVDFAFSKKILFSYPKIENSTSISSYCFKHRIVETDATSAYYRKPSQITSYGNNVYLIRYFLDGYGEAYQDSDNLSERLNIGDINIARLPGVFQNPNNVNIYVIPIKNNVYENIINIDNIGEMFYEDNPINPYDAESNVAQNRKDFLNEYFSNYSTSISFESLANVSIETGDIIEVDTNLYDENGRQINKKAMIISMELNYNGSLRQKIKAHEVVL